MCVCGVWESLEWAWGSECVWCVCSVSGVSVVGACVECVFMCVCGMCVCLWCGYVVCVCECECECGVCAVCVNVNVSEGCVRCV